MSEVLHTLARAYVRAPSQLGARLGLHHSHRIQDLGELLGAQLRLLQRNLRASPARVSAVRLQARRLAARASAMVRPVADARLC